MGFEISRVDKKSFDLYDIVPQLAIELGTPVLVEYTDKSKTRATIWFDSPLPDNAKKILESNGYALS